MSSRTKNLASGVLWTTIYNIVNAIYGFIAIPILIEHYGKAEYGLIGLALSINVYMQFMDLGFNSTNIRFFSLWLSNGDYEKLKRAFKSSLSFYGIIGIINSVVLIFVTVFSYDIFDVTPTQNSTLRQLLLILTISAVINWYSSCFDQLIKSTENVAWVQRRSLIPKFIQIILLFVVVKLNITLTLYFAITTFAFVAILPISIKKIRELTPGISFKPKWDKEIMKEILPYCMGILSFNIFQFSFYNLRPVFLGIEGTLDQVADYRILNGILGVVSMFAGMFISVLLPTTSKVVHEHNQSAYDRVAYDGTKYITLIVSFCCFGLMSVGPELLTLYVGSSYLYLIPALNLWLICSLGTHNQAISSLILAGSHLRPLAINSAIASIIGLTASWFMIPDLGVIGVIWAFAIYLMVQMLFFYLYYWPKVMRINSWRILTKSFLPPVAYGFLAYWIARMIPLNMSAWENFWVYGLLFSVFFVLLSFCSMSSSDKEFILKIIRKNK